MSAAVERLLASACLRNSTAPNRRAAVGTDDGWRPAQPPRAAALDRVSLGAALVFLELNGASVDAAEGELVDLTVGAADGTISKAEVATFLQGHS